MKPINNTQQLCVLFELLFEIFIPNTTKTGIGLPISKTFTVITNKKYLKEIQTHKKTN